MSALIWQSVTLPDCAFEIHPQSGKYTSKVRVVRLPVNTADKCYVYKFAIPKHVINIFLKACLIFALAAIENRKLSTIVLRVA